MLRFIKTASKVTVGLFSGLTVALAVAYAALTVVGYKPVAVYSGSMQPTIPVGGLVLDRAIEREPPDRDLRLHGAGVDGHRLVADSRQSGVGDREGDGRPRDEAHRHLACRLDETLHSSYA